MPLSAIAAALILVQLTLAFNLRGAANHARKKREEEARGAKANMAARERQIELDRYGANYGPPPSPESGYGYQYGYGRTPPPRMQHNYV